MKKLDITILAVLFLGGVFLLLSGGNKPSKEISPNELQQKLIQNTRYISPEDVAHLIITKDPSLQLIDIREPKFYNKFSLNGALNIPLKDFLKEDNLAYLDQDVYKTILFSNGTTNADVAWMMATRLGYKNVYVMKGGLNQWVYNILQPKEHSIIWDRVDDQMYQYRKGASQYFGGKSVEVESSNETLKPRKKPVRRKKKEVEGGCG